MDTLYTLCRAADNRHALPLGITEAAEVVTHKRACFTAEAEQNPLVREILTGGRVTYDGIAADDRRAFLIGPATFFRTHEILRKTRSANRPICVGPREYAHDEVVAMFARCIPNVTLEYIPWCSMSRYLMSLGLAWSTTLIVSLIVARGNESTSPLDGAVLVYMGTITTMAALTHTALRRNRDMRHAAPWNSALYLDLNADLLRRGSLALAVARKEFVPQQKPFKTRAFYYAIARGIESRAFDADLSRHLSSESKHWEPSSVA